MKKGDKIYCYNSFNYSTVKTADESKVTVMLLTAGKFYEIKRVKPIMASYNGSTQLEHYCEISSDLKSYYLIFRNFEEFSTHCYTLKEYRKKKLEKISS